MGETCRDTRRCFAAMENRGYRKCTILTNTYILDGACKFCKPDRNITDGKKYEYNVHYAGRGRNVY